MTAEQREEQFIEYLESFITKIGDKTRKQYLDCFKLYERIREECESYGIKSTNRITIAYVKRHGTPNPNGTFYINCKHHTFLKHYYVCFSYPHKEIPPRGRRSYVKHEKAKFLTPQQIRLFTSSVDKHTALVSKIMFETGLRVTELLKTSKDDIDMKNKVITGIGKHGKLFKVYFSETVKKFLYLWFTVAPNQDYPFLYTLNPNLESHRVRLACTYIKYSKKLGFHVSAHKFRHGLGRHLFQSGADMETIRAALRHTRYDTTAIYINTQDEDVENFMRSSVFMDVKV